MLKKIWLNAFSLIYTSLHTKFPLFETMLRIVLRQAYQIFGLPQLLPLKQTFGNILDPGNNVGVATFPRKLLHRQYELVRCPG